MLANLQEAGRTVRWLQRFGSQQTEEAVVPPSVQAAISVDLVYEQVLRSVDTQHENVRSIDGKASFILTSATLVMGLNGLGEVGEDKLIPNTLWMLPSSMLFLGVVVAVFRAYRSRTFSSPAFSPSELQEYLFNEREYTQRQFIAALRATHEGNSDTIKLKGKWLRISEILFVSQVFVVMVTTIVASNWDRIDELLECAF